MRDNDNLSNSLAQSRHSETTNDKLTTVQRMAELSKANRGAYNFVKTVKNGEKIKIPKEFLPIYAKKPDIHFGILSFKSNIKPRNVRVSPSPATDPLDISSANIHIRAKHNIDTGDFNFSFIAKLAFLSRAPVMK